MCAKWNGEYDVGLLLWELQDSRTYNEATGEFQGFEGWNPFEDVLAVLHSCVDFARYIIEMDRSSIIYESVFAVGHLDEMTPDALIAEMNRRERDYWQRDERAFVLTTSISIRSPNPLANTSISGHRITFGDRLPRRFAREHAKVREQGRHVIFGELPKWWSMIRGYLPARVSVRARSNHEAYEKAIGALDLLRGIWNLRLNSSARSSFGKREPVNVLQLGPLHSLHKLSGELATETYWYDAEYVEPVKSASLRSEQARLRTFETTMRKYLSKSHYREELEAAIRRYTRVLDSREWNTAFVQMWSLLEYLTATSEDPNKVTLKRALSLSHKDEREFHRQVLKHLMTYRNRTVHAGYTSEAIETHLYQLKRYVERVLLFHIYSAPDFASIGKAAEFMHLPPELPELRRKRWLIERAIRYHR